MAVRSEQRVDGALPEAPVVASGLGSRLPDTSSWQFGALAIGASVAGWVAIELWPVRWWGFENGPVEWLGTLFFATASVVLAIAARRHTDRARKIMAGLLSALFLLCFLEELSWGQQIFQWSTPPAFDSNLQNETNLHNFSYFVDLQRAFTVGILSLTVLVPLIHRFWAWGRNLLQRFGIPVVSLTVSLWVVVMLICDTIYGAGEWDTERTRLGREALEMLWAVAATIVAFTALRDSRNGNRELAPATS